MGKRRGFQPQGYINPIALARQAGPAEHSGPTIRDYLNRPRPSWDEVKGIMAEKDKTSRALEEWEKNMQKDWRNELDDYRQQVMKRREKEARKKDRKKKKKKKKKKAEEKKRKRQHSDSSSTTTTTTTTDSDSDSDSESGETGKERKRKKRKQKKQKRKKQHRKKGKDELKLSTFFAISSQDVV